jgi:hypothetical protein
LLSVELAGLLSAFLLSMLKRPQPWLRDVEGAFVKISSHRHWAVAGCALAVLIGRLALLPLFPIPVPGVHDEYSYLLNGATFALGRLTNPPDPMWPFFESFHILQQPNYISMYPVAQGLFLALGFLLGLPWLGVLVGVAAFCAAVTWAFQGWLTPQWALLGGVLAVLKFGLVSYLIDSYWGGAIPALGRALVLGSVPRIIRRTRVSDALWFSLGILLLANSRPFEGLVFVGCVVAWMTFQVAKAPAILSAPRVASFAVPVASVLLLGGCLMAVYFRATTGDMLKMPYVRYAEEYAITKPFLWEKLRPEPVFHNAVMRQYYEREEPLYRRAKTLRGWGGELFRKLSTFAMFYLWPGLSLVVITLPLLFRTVEGRVSLLVIGVVLAGISLEIWPMMLHYPAPATIAALLLLICAIRAARPIAVGGFAVGLGLSWAVPALCAVALSLRIAAAAAHFPVPEHGLIPWLTVAPGNLTREAIVSELENLAGCHLVIVRYGPRHDVSQEWVYNSPSLHTARIVWARERDASETNELIRRFAGRNVWLLQPDRTPPVLTPYR